MFGGMDDDGFYYVRTLGWGCHTSPHRPFQRGLLSWGGDEQRFLMDTWMNGQTGHLP